MRNDHSGGPDAGSRIDGGGVGGGVGVGVGGGGGGVGVGGGGGGGAAPGSPVRPPELLQAQARLLNLAVEAQLPSGDPVADLMAQLPRGDPAEVARKVARHREARAAALQDPPPQQGSASSSLDVLLSRNGLLQS